ncbi:hypothetical protein [Jiangella alkaliphila]|uniref:hypothetical protein n=1 Tax=Jiangella alkaliphila TaxID=419479 RepID=UPI00128B569A|nr:hypothetical protein [Jiangella alkaliphila]
MRVAVTGHRSLDEVTASLISHAIRKHLATIDRLVGISCLTEGADRLFARAVLDVGGRLVIVVPSARHRDLLPVSSLYDYDALLNRAFDVVRLRFDESDPEALLAASRHMLERADELVAVWNGRPACRLGGPADVVREALRLRVTVKVIWPASAPS